MRERGVAKDLFIWPRRRWIEEQQQILARVEAAGSGCGARLEPTGLQKTETKRRALTVARDAAGFGMTIEGPGGR
jgi:hypothetical protein